MSIPQSYRSRSRRADLATLEIPVPRQAGPLPRQQQSFDTPVRPRRRWTWAAGGLALGLVVSSAGVLSAAYSGFIAPGAATPARFVATGLPPRAVSASGTSASDGSPSDGSPSDGAPAMAASDAAAASGPRTSVGDGTWRVGDDIAPGTYATAGPDGSSCYYARLKSNDGSVGDIIDIKVTNGPANVVIRPTDGYFKTAYCKTWNKVG